MRFALFGVLCALGALLPSPGYAQHRSGVPGMGHAGRHNPFSHRYTPVGFSGWGGGSSWSSTVVSGGGLTVGFGGWGFPGPYAPGYGGFGWGGYNPTFVSGPIYPYGMNGVWGPYSNYGPLVLPGNQLFGPAALPQGAFLPQHLQPNTPAPVENIVRPVVVDRPAQKAPANAAALERAMKFIDFGDRLFGEQKYHEAYNRYQSACHAAPDLADAHFRRGFSLLTLGRYERAREAFQQGLKLNPRWSESKFRLDDLYGDNKAAKKAQFDVLATTLEQNPEQFDAMFLLGVMLYFDGQAERSRPFLNKAFELWDEQKEGQPAAAVNPGNPPAANPPAPKPAEEATET